MSHRDKADDDGGGDAGPDQGPRKDRQYTARDPKRIVALIDTSSTGWDGWWPMATEGDICALVRKRPDRCYFRLWSGLWMTLRS